MILAILIPASLIGFAWLLRKGLDATLWHEANMFVDTNGNLLIFE
jgi:hypothetical protein